MATRRNVPNTPRTTSPTPTPPATSSFSSKSSDYFSARVTRSTSKKAAGQETTKESSPMPDGVGADDLDEEDRARSRSRSRDDTLRRRISGLTNLDGSAGKASSSASSKQAPVQTNGSATKWPNGHLSPASAGESRNYWRSLSRSPSPLGLIPIHQEWRAFIHRHEIPRKLLHVSIGFLTLALYAFGYQTSSIHPVLLAMLIPIAALDVLRRNWPPFNRLYTRVMGAFMRESEVHERYNGVIWYLLGAWAVLRFCQKDIGVISVVLLSWCDTAASSFGRAYGRYTPKIRQGKSLAGSAAAYTVGVLTALLWWGYLAPRYERLGFADNTGPNAFAFQGVLELPDGLKGLLGRSSTLGQTRLTGGLALGVMSLVAGFVASASEAVDILGWDDNLTIPLLCGMGFWAFLRVFGSA